MKKWEKKAGKSFLDRLDEEVLVIGRTSFSRRQMIDELHCGNFAAAKVLSEALRRFKPKSAKELARRIGVADLFAIKGVGVTTVYVWMCVLHVSEINPEKWLDHSTTLPTIYASRPRRHLRLVAPAKRMVV